MGWGKVARRAQECASERIKAEQKVLVGLGQPSREATWERSACRPYCPLGGVPGPVIGDRSQKRPHSTNYSLFLSFFLF